MGVQFRLIVLRAIFAGSFGTLVLASMADPTDNTNYGMTHPTIVEAATQTTFNVSCPIGVSPIVVGNPTQGRQVQTCFITGQIVFIPTLFATVNFSNNTSGQTNLTGASHPQQNLSVNQPGAPSVTAWIKNTSITVFKNDVITFPVSTDVELKNNSTTANGTAVVSRVTDFYHLTHNLTVFLANPVNGTLTILQQNLLINIPGQNLSVPTEGPNTTQNSIVVIPNGTFTARLERQTFPVNTSTQFVIATMQNSTIKITPDYHVPINVTVEKIAETFTGEETIGGVLTLKAGFNYLFDKTTSIALGG